MRTVYLRLYSSYIFFYIVFFPVALCLSFSPLRECARFAFSDGKIFLCVGAATEYLLNIVVAGIYNDIHVTIEFQPIKQNENAALSLWGFYIFRIHKFGYAL